MHENVGNATTVVSLGAVYFMLGGCLPRTSKERAVSSDLTDEDLQKIWQSVHHSSGNPLWRERAKRLIDEVRRLQKELEDQLSQPRSASTSEDTAIL